MTHRFSYTFELLPGVSDAYLREHDHIDPAVVAAMRRAGITRYSLFQRNDTITASGDTITPVLDTFRALELDPVNRAWSDHIRKFMHDPLGEDGQLRIAEEIWRTD